MSKTLLFIISIIFFSCNESPKPLKIGLTKNAKRIDEYIIKVKYDSVNNTVYDTLILKIRNYNKIGKTIKSSATTLFDKEIIEIHFVYDSLNRIKKEIVSMSIDSSTFDVNYFYKDSLLRYVKAESVNEGFRFNQIANYEYYKNKKLKVISMSQFYIDLKENDTISNSIELDEYNKDGVLIETKFNDLKNELNNKRHSYKLNSNGMFNETKEFDLNDSLVSSTTFKYLLDEFGNWTEKKSYDNDTLIRINIREIKY